MRERPKRLMGSWLPEHDAEMKRLCSLAVALNMEHETLNANTKEFLAGSGHHFGLTSEGTRQAMLWHMSAFLEETR
jgi:hypothetical protein